MAAIYLLRHAEAVSHKGARARHDPERPLSAEGRARMERAARGVGRLGLTFDAILTSPYVRARQTAEIVAAALESAEGPRIEDDLASGARWDEVRRLLAALQEPASVLLVGHEPDLSRMAAEIIGAPRGSLDFGKGTLACVVVDRIPPREPGVLFFLLRSGQLEAIGG